MLWLKLGAPETVSEVIGTDCESHYADWRQIAEGPDLALGAPQRNPEVSAIDYVKVLVFAQHTGHFVEMVVINQDKSDPRIKSGADPLDVAKFDASTSLVECLAEHHGIEVLGEVVGNDLVTFPEMVEWSRAAIEKYNAGARG